jgi:hypothetical protein
MDFRTNFIAVGPESRACQSRSVTLCFRRLVPGSPRDTQHEIHFPPVATSQPSGMNGMMVTVAMKVPVEPSAPRTPSRLSQMPASSSDPKVHSETPRKSLAPAWPNTGYSHQINGPLLMNGTSLSNSCGNYEAVGFGKDHVRRIVR